MNSQCIGTYYPTGQTERQTNLRMKYCPGVFSPTYEEFFPPANEEFFPPEMSDNWLHQFRNIYNLLNKSINRSPPLFPHPPLSPTPQMATANKLAVLPQILHHTQLPVFCNDKKRKIVMTGLTVCMGKGGGEN